MTQRRRFVLAIVIAWCAIALGSFSYFVARKSTDDVSGCIIAMLVVQIPAFWALAPGRPLERRRVIALVAAAALVVIFSAFFFGVLISEALWHHELERSLVVAAISVAVQLGLGLGLGLCARRRWPHHSAVRFIVVAAAVSGAALLLAYIPLRRAVGADSGSWIIVTASLAWTAPLWLLLPQRAHPIPEARARR